MNSTLTENILKFYQANKRDLPWRENRDPYRVWLSEIILQQTRIAQGTPYFLKFIDKYPSVDALAEAKEDEVLRMWQGLGYYSRARNMLKCARIIADQHKGKFPTRALELEKLPGIGKYTAAAIASICFEEAIAVVDGNVIRVITRLFAFQEAADSSRGLKSIQDLANSIVSKEFPGQFNQGMMELGSLICTPKKPACNQCVVQEFCQARELGITDKLPLKKGKAKSRERFFNYLCGRDKNGKLWIQQRTKEKDIWYKMYEFPMVETKGTLH
ncbi:MAG: A/G-specific adenine glycosylase, partial [Luteibaculum sp.]